MEGSKERKTVNLCEQIKTSTVYTAGDQKNNLSLKVRKTKELIADFRKQKIEGPCMSLHRQNGGGESQRLQDPGRAHHWWSGPSTSRHSYRKITNPSTSSGDWGDSACHLILVWTSVGVRQGASYWLHHAVTRTPKSEGGCKKWGHCLVHHRSSPHHHQRES